MWNFINLNCTFLSVYFTSCFLRFLFSIMGYNFLILASYSFKRRLRVVWSVSKGKWGISLQVKHKILMRPSVWMYYYSSKYNFKVARVHFNLLWTLHTEYLRVLPALQSESFCPQFLRNYYGFSFIFLIYKTL